MIEGDAVDLARFGLAVGHATRDAECRIVAGVRAGDRVRWLADRAPINH